MLKIEHLHAGYAHTPVLHGLSLSLAPGQILALLGRNGSGRSTLARAIVGGVAARGHISWQGHKLLGLPSHQIARLGVGHVPENRDVFAQLTVRQNLLLGVKSAATKKPQPPDGFAQPSFDLPAAYRMFPALEQRAQVLAGLLSGGEQQMLALARTLMGQPTLLIVDEPTEGLAPQVIAQVAACLQTLRQQGCAVLLIEQKRTLAFELADRVAVMGKGQLVFEGSADELYHSPSVQAEWLGV
jgi:branched-chain amino acid transport system ATP-binding protein